MGALLHNPRQYRREFFRDNIAGRGNLGGHWGERSGSALLDYVAGETATLSGGYSDGAYLTPRWAPRSVDYDGTNGVATISDLAHFASIHQTWRGALCGWARLDATGQLFAICGSSVTGAAKGISVYVEDRGGVATRELRSILSNGITTRQLKSTSAAITVGVPFHWGITFDATDAQLWLNGSSVHTLSLSGFATATGNATNVFEIGDVGGFAGPWNGDVGPVSWFTDDKRAVLADIYAGGQ